MGFFDKMLGKRADPTADWPPSADLMPIVLPYRARFGDLKFGTPISAAHPLGKPDRFRWTQPGYCQLLYTAAGFQIDFDAEKFAYLALLLEKYGAEPRVMLPEGETVSLSRRSNRAEIESHFGTPSRIDEDADETILFYETRAVTMEFELHPTRSSLRRWNLFPSP